jgi:MFS transporter, PAT family, beta-lactamase induction signal transducer AmpG
MSHFSNRKLWLLGSLYISQYIPIMFMMTGLPVYLRERGFSLEQIGLVSAVALPIALKFLWSPLIDRYSVKKFGHYRFWIIGFQVFAALVSVAIAFLDLERQFPLLILLSAFQCALCTSQDVATDALAIRLLDRDERGVGNGIQKAGTYLGAIIGGGGVLVLLERWGWQNTMLGIAVITILALLPILQFDESEVTPIETQPRSLKRNYVSIISFFQRPGMGIWTIVLLLYMLGSSMLWGMLRPFLVDLGLSMQDIGIMIGILAFSSGIPAALATGAIVRPLGPRKSLIYVGLFQAAALATYLLPTFGWKSLPVLYTIAMIAQVGTCAAETVIATISMEKSRDEYPGSDYALQNSFLYLSGIFAMMISGFITSKIGYQGLFLICVMVTLGAALFIALTYRHFNLSEPTLEPVELLSDRH